MATKTWPACAAERKANPGQWQCITNLATSLKPERLQYLKGRAEEVGLQAEIRPLVHGRRPEGLFVRWKEN